MKKKKPRDMGANRLDDSFTRPEADLHLAALKNPRQRYHWRGRFAKATLRITLIAFQQDSQSYPMTKPGSTEKE